MASCSLADGTVTNPDSDLTLVDYFVLVGLDKDAGLTVDNSCDVSVELTNGQCRNSTPPMERSYVSKVLSHFPQVRKSLHFSHDIVSLCMPKGLRFYTEKDVPKPAIHTFANIREDGSRVNGCALIFYEEVRDLSICEQMSLLHTEHVRELTAMEKHSDRVHHPPGTVSGGNHTLPRGSRKNRSKRISYYDVGCNQLYMSKCICLITRIPIVDACENVLNAFYSMICSDSQPPQFALESYIYWMLNEVPLPAPGSTLKVSLNSHDLVLQRPGSRELPFFDYALRKLFDLVTVEKFLRLFTCFLLEHQILLCSRSLKRLMLVAESLCALAFPFRWQLTYVPILPYSQLKFVEAPVPYIMGLCYEDCIPEQIFQSNVCVMDLDTGELDLPEDVPPLPQARHLATEITNLLNKAHEECTAEVKMRPKKTSGLSARKKDEWTSKRMSRSFDDHAMGSVLQNSLRLSNVDFEQDESDKEKDSPPLNDAWKMSETLARVQAIARRAGVAVEMDSIEQEINSNDSFMNSPTCKSYFKDMKLNNSIREVVLNVFVCLLYSYDNFMIGGGMFEDSESYFANRDSVANFDKASFLSDQPDSHLPFLAAFLETQMFTSFIDSKILSQWETADENLVTFEDRVERLRQKLGSAMVRTPTYETATATVETDDLITKREEAFDYIVPQPHAIAGAVPDTYCGIFPELNSILLEGSQFCSPIPSPWKQRHRRLRPKKFDSEDDLSQDLTGNFLDGTGSGSTNAANRRSTYGMGDTPEQIAKQNWKFVDQLLKETKGKTKRMLVEKMGKEAVQLGHVDPSVTGVEENTLVASLCDLLERIWAHGMFKKQGKSALWAHVLLHQEFEKTDVKAPLMTTSLSPAEAHRSKIGFSAGDLEDDVENKEVNVSNVGKLTEIVQNIQKELKIEGAAEEDAPAWSKSILRAANFICDKISSASTTSSVLGPTLSSTMMGRSQSFQRFPNQKLTKANSVSDFTPHWTGSSDNVAATANHVEFVRPERKRSLSRPRSPDPRVALEPLPNHIAYDLKNVLRMTEIKTEIGFARAFVRLALERKLLHKHLKTILSKHQILQKLYKRYAFLRCDDEKEQFLFHILSLNAADFNCFTNTFPRTKMQYEILLVTGNTKHLASAGAWILLAGSLNSTPIIPLPTGSLQFTFDHMNLGVLSTLRIGHDREKIEKSGTPPKWFLDYVIVRNQITSQTYRFSCGRWFGRGVDDGSLERLLVAECLPRLDPEAEAPVSTFQSANYGSSNGSTSQVTSSASKSGSRSRTPSRVRSPSAGRSSDAGQGSKTKTRTAELQHLLGASVNALVQHFYASEKGGDRQLTQLLCGDRGLVFCLEQVFALGRYDAHWTNRLFKQPYPWDYVEKVSGWFFNLFHCGEYRKLTREQRALIVHSCNLVQKISANNAVGKDGKFHAFILLTLRDHVLSGLLPLMAWTPVTSQMYDETSFLRNPTHLSYLSKLLNSLNEFQFKLEKSLTYGIE
ncbi:hypothetical protein QR680_000107 [Steinernema hermaphroditum]|uniref:DENN domain-containing protein 5A n=1 Tax=Steinernema hermaphroditum TaxID=289476 RepID=A0AA39LDJ8_9BILA|nr:hypothetical protein QR680_000107 [Steinernema hermaphroditum]